MNNSFHNYRNNRSQGRNRGLTRFTRDATIDPSLFVKKATIELDPVYFPKNKFSDFPLCEQIKRNISRRGYITPTQIQDQAMPYILEGKDVIGIAKTGTGKTAAFLIPLINKIFLFPDKKVLIITPTRELASQIYNELRLFSFQMPVCAVLVIGGASINRQMNELRRNVKFIIGTPGRLKDLESRGLIHFHQYSTIVLDEVDRMLDMGFIHDIKHIISALPAERQSLCFSATLPEEIRKLANEFLRNPVLVTVQPGKPSANVDQDIIRTNGKQKIEILHELLIQEDFIKVLVFGRTKRGVEKLAKELQRRGFQVASIHGNKSQGQRQRALEEFKNNRVKILLATDLASRGLDIEDISHVINYDLPASYEDYIHRVGRTGRVDKKGKALTFID